MIVHGNWTLYLYTRIPSVVNIACCPKSTYSYYINNPFKQDSPLNLLMEIWFGPERFHCSSKKT